jgi:2,4-dienoyl-CoA reductase-like NADH-dependent reductase (Old Yellow Enzyme family)
VTAFPRLFEPFQLKQHRLRNRVVWLPHLTNFAKERGVSDRHIAYYEERAKLGVGFIIMGSETVNGHYPNPGRIDAFDSRNVEGFKRLADTMHRHGTVLVGQLTEDGSQNMADHTLDWAYERSASDVADWAVGRIPKIMERSDIEESFQFWLRCVRNHQAGELDGTELKVAHDGLPRQFLSPFYNRRHDEWGGSRENRLRFLRELLHLLRDEVGSDYVLGMRYAFEEGMPGGYDLQEGLAMLETIVSWRIVDYVTSDLGVHTALRWSNPPMATEPGFARPQLRAARSVVDVPLIGYGRIKLPELAEDMLVNDECDLIGVARALLVDPEWLLKAQEGRSEETRICIGCNQGCLDRIWQGREMTCILNPAAGRERQWGVGTLTPAEKPKRVIVIGGGPAGLKTAEIAARRGHQVTIFESRSKLGGAVLDAAKAPVRIDIWDATASIETQLDQLGVEVWLGYAVEPELIEQVGAAVRIVARSVAPPASPGSLIETEGDVVVLATGSSSVVPDGLDLDDERIFEVGAALDGAIPAGARVVIIDTEGTYASTATAEKLADEGHPTTLVTSLLTVGSQIGPPGWQVLMPELHKRGVSIKTQSELAEAALPHLRFRNVLGGPAQDVEGDVVVLTAGRRSRDEFPVEVGGVLIHRVGDCVAPRDIGMAIYAGEQLGRSL